MKIIDLLKDNKLSMSFEVFPPKSSVTKEKVTEATLAIEALKPGYMSVTYGAGGSTDVYTGEIASIIKARGTEAIAHLSCIGATKESVAEKLQALKSAGIENILALRGDLPLNSDKSLIGDYLHASDLARQIRAFGGFCIGGACYPEGHPESPSIEADIEALRIKVECGCEYLTTQMFFDNDIIFTFMDRLARAGINVPVVPGVMPVTSAKQVNRIVEISGNALPSKFLNLVEKYGENDEEMYKAGIEYATGQIEALYKSGFNAVHVYSMNKPEVAREIQENLKEIIR